MKIYTDGSCFPNPNGCGGWAFIVVDNNRVVYRGFGNDKSTTNNRMELTAIIEALEWVGVRQATIYSDSQYSINSIVVWYDGWVKRNTLDKKANTDLIGYANELYKERNVKIEWVRGHDGNEYNEMADELCNLEMMDLYKEINGIELSMAEIKHSFDEMKQKYKNNTPSIFKKTPKKHKDKRGSENIFNKRLAIIAQNTEGNKIETITTNIKKPNYIVVNGVKYKKLH
jgi:ribonuclease HI